MGHASACPFAMAYYQRNLPHWQPQGASLFITWRLDGSLPVSCAKPESSATLRISAGQAFRAWDARLDAASSGPVWLRDPRLAAMVVAVLHHGERDKKLYRLSAYVVMSNHVHVLLEPLAPAATIMHWIKGVTAREANRLLGRDGVPFWQHESYDHWVRKENEGQRIIRYPESNPVVAGLVERVEQWPWSSACRPVGDADGPAQAEACAT